MKLFANPSDGAPGLLLLRRTGGAHRQGRGPSRYRPLQGRAGRCRSVDRVHGHDQPRPDRVQLPRPVLRVAREVPGRVRRRARPRVPRDHRRRVQPPGRLARHGDGGARALGRVKRRRLASPPAARGRGAERSARGHPAGTDPLPRLLGQHRHPAPPGRPARGHHRPRAEGQRRHDLRRGRQPSPRPRMARVPGRHRCPTTSP